jgi:hypothetical protein
MVGGISGDMLLAALLHCGVPRELIEGELALLPLRGYKLEVADERRSGLGGLKVSVLIDEHHHGHEDHHHRSHRDISAMIAGSGVNAPAKALALRVFGRLADAEAKVHGSTPDDVEFHEVGAVDSIVDIVACSVAITFLAPEAVYCCAPVLGSGRTKSQHGEIPLPAPATVELLKGMPSKISAKNGETITPTGAAFLAELCEVVTETPPMTITATGHGFGTRRGPGLNLLRVIHGDRFRGTMDGDAVMIEANIDDMNPQLIPNVVSSLIELGAHDAWTTPVNMKKGRPAFVLSALVPQHLVPAATQFILSETTSIGVRFSGVGRICLERKSVKVDTAYGPVSIRVAHSGGVLYNASPEFEDCVRAAGRCGVPVKEAYAAAVEAWRTAAALAGRNTG